MLLVNMELLDVVRRACLELQQRVSIDLFMSDRRNSLILLVILCFVL